METRLDDTRRRDGVAYEDAPEGYFERRGLRRYAGVGF